MCTAFLHMPHRRSSKKPGRTTNNKKPFLFKEKFIFFFLTWNQKLIYEVCPVNVSEAKRRLKSLSRMSKTCSKDVKTHFSTHSKKSESRSISFVVSLEVNKSWDKRKKWVLKGPRISNTVAVLGKREPAKGQCEISNNYGRSWKCETRRNIACDFVINLKCY